MALRNTTRRWGAVAQLLHWLIVIFIITQFTLFALFDDLPAGARKLTLLARHKSVGITILMLAILRLAWRWANPTPDLPDTLKPYERRLARFTHGLLYVLLFAVPLAGWTLSSARGFPVSWFGLFTLPDLVPKNKVLYDTLMDTHAILAWTLGVVATIHLLAALKHHFVLKDDVLKRMLPFTARKGNGAALAAAAPAAAVLALALCAPPPAAAEAASGGAHYVLDPARSTLEFAFSQAGAQNKGAFKHFTTVLDFSADNLPASHLEVTVDTTSVDTGDQERDDTLRGADLFSVRKFPQARFTAQIVKSASGYEAVGKLTIRDITRDLRLPLTLRTATEQGANVCNLSGRITLKRLDFGVGQGDWKATDQVGNDVGVSFALRLVAH
jgi:cytochrome b561/polyisoprenoid-binding protein YceI